MAVIIVYIIIFAPMANAISSFCCTSPSSSDHHGTQKSAIDKAHDELNDYYKDGDHIKDNNGRSEAYTLKTIQKFQPQNYIFCGHGSTKSKGRKIMVGGPSEEWLSAYRIQDRIETAGKTGPRYAAIPFSATVFMACYSAVDQSDKHNFRDVFIPDLGGWVFIGALNGIDFRDGGNFIKSYTDKITDGKKSYYRAFDEAVPWFCYRDFKIRLVSWSKGSYGLDHDTDYDKYRYIDRVRANEGSTIYKGAAISTKLYYYRDFTGTTNGAYFTFHGIINNNEQVIDKTADIRIKIFRWDGSQYVQIRNDLYSGITNHEYDYYTDTAYGGSDICSRRISAGAMNYVGTDHIKVEVTFVSGSASYIYIDRFEFMEIGK